MRPRVVPARESLPPPVLDEREVFRWIGGEPGERWTLRDGTPLVRGR